MFYFMIYKTSDLGLSAEPNIKYNNGSQLRMINLITFKYICGDTKLF